jgi:hypothetical protein
MQKRGQECEFTARRGFDNCPFVQAGMCDDFHREEPCVKELKFRLGKVKSLRAKGKESEVIFFGELVDCIA